MSSKYKQFMLSTCLPVAVCLIVAAPVKAGFEWTPPEKKEIPAPVMMEPVVPETVDSEGLPPVENMIEEPAEEDAPIQIKVLEEESVVEDTAIEDPITQISEENAAPIMISEPPMIEEEAPVIEEIPAVEKTEEKDAFSIAPFPMEETQENTSSNAVIVLPEDEEDISDLSSQDVIVKENAPKAEAKEEIFWNEPETFDVIEGFGTDMPMALALRQIVPAKYAYSFGAGVNPGAPISWEGGKPWNEVLTEALSPLGYTYKIKGQKVILNKSVMESTPEPEPMPIEAPSEKPVEIDSEEEHASDVSQESIDEVLDSAIEAEEDVHEVVEVSHPIHEQEADIAMPANNIETSELQRDEAKTVETKIINVSSEEPIEITEVSEVPEETGLKPVEVDENDLAETLMPDVDNLASEADMETAQQSDEPALSDEKKNEVELSEVEVDPQNNPELKVLEIPALEETQELTKLEEDAMNEIASDVPMQLEEIAPAAVDIETEAVIKLSQDTEGHHRTSPSNDIRLWEAKKGANLKKIVEEWSAQENIHLVWNAPEDYKVSQKTIINGTFKNAIDVLLSKGTKSAPKYTLTESPDYKIQIDVK